MIGCYADAALIRDALRLLHGSVSPLVKRGRLRYELSQALSVLEHVGPAGLLLVLDGFRRVVAEDRGTLDDVITAAAARVWLDRRCAPRCTV